MNIGDQRKAGDTGPAGDQRPAGDTGAAGDPRNAGEANAKSKPKSKTTKTRNPEDTPDPEGD